MSCRPAIDQNTSPHVIMRTPLNGSLSCVRVPCRYVVRWAWHAKARTARTAPTARAQRDAHYRARCAAVRACLDLARPRPARPGSRQPSPRAARVPEGGCGGPRPSRTRRGSLLPPWPRRARAWMRYIYGAGLRARARSKITATIKSSRPCGGVDSGQVPGSD